MEKPRILLDDIDYDSVQIERLNNHISQLIEKDIIVSGNYCLARSGHIFANQAIGTTPDMPFAIQSITKMFTTVAILRLMEENKLRLNQRVCEVIPEFQREPFDTITILHLLTHTSGLVAWEGVLPGVDTCWYPRIDESNVKQSWIEAILSFGLYHEPGEAWVYSMAGFTILGEIIGRIAGMQAEAYIRKTIIEPCEMTDTFWGWERPWERFPVFLKWREIPETAGGLISTAKDLAQFGIMLAEGGTYHGTYIIGEESIRLLEENQIREGMREYCWGHEGERITYGAGCSLYTGEFPEDIRVSKRTIYHEGLGVCVLMVNRRDRFAAVWNMPFKREDEWYAEAASEPATIIWKGIRQQGL